MEIDRGLDLHNFNVLFFLIFRDRERRKRPKGHIENSQHQSGIVGFINSLRAFIKVTKIENVFFNFVV